MLKVLMGGVALAALAAALFVPMATRSVGAQPMPSPTPTPTPISIGNTPIPPLPTSTATTGP
jgi:hypothetical protein